VRMDVKFPIFVFEKDDHSMYLVEELSRLLYHLEAIDIENGEYVFWDSTGAGVCVTVARNAIDQISACNQPMSLSEAFEAYSESLAIRTDPQGPPIEVWRRIQSQIPKRTSFWRRLFAKTHS